MLTDIQDVYIGNIYTFYVSKHWWLSK